MWKVVFIDQAAKPFYEDLIKEIFLRTNKTDCEDYQSYHPDIYFSLMYLFAEVNLLSTNEQLPTLVTTNFQGYQFLTCYSKRYLTFAHFIKPFQVEVWVILFIFLVVLILGITLYIRFGGLGSTPFSPWLFILATMCEEGVLVPAELEKKAFFRYTFGAWILVSVVLVNCYNGIMVTDLNAPLPGETPSVFKDLLCPGELMSERDYKMRTQHKNKKATERFYEAWGLRIVGNDFWRREDCFHLLSYPLDPSGYQGLKTYPFFEFLYDTTFWYWISHFNEDRITEQILVLFTFLKSKQSFEPSAVTEEETKPRWPEYHLIPHLNASIEKEVVACGKAVLIREVADMQAELQFLKKYYHWIEFHKGNEILSPQPYGSHFVRAGNSKIPRLYESLLDAGILERIDEKYHASKFIGRKPVVKERRGIDPYIKIEGGILSLFILCMFANCIAFGVFSIEIVILCKKRGLLLVFWYKCRYSIRKVFNGSWRCKRTCKCV